METLFLKKTADVRDNIKLLKEKLNVNLSLQGNKITFEGSPVDEYVAEKVFSAIQFGFTVKQALPLIDPEMQFIKINIKDFTRRKDMYDVRSRVIGKEGKTKRTIESISNCSIVLNENTAGIIGPAQNIDAATNGLKNIVKGSKQSNVYNYLEKMNVEKKKFKDIDLGLKDKEKDE